MEWSFYHSGMGMGFIPAVLSRNGNGNHSGCVSSEWEWECIPKIPGMDTGLDLNGTFEMSGILGRLL